MRRAAGVGDGDSVQEWFASLPIITKTLLVSTLLMGFGVTFNFVSPYSVIFDWPSIKDKFHVWRLLTSFIFLGQFSFNFAVHTYVLYQNSLRYEVNPFNTGAGGTSADYLWMLMLCMTTLHAVGFLFDMPVLSEPLLYAIMYTWSRKDPDSISNIFGFKFKSLYLPWMYVVIETLMGHPVMGLLLGIAVGHLYYFMVEVLPVTHGYSLINTPQFCMDIINYVTGRSQPTATHSPFAGRAHTLGGVQAPRTVGGVFSSMFGGRTGAAAAVPSSNSSVETAPNAANDTTGLRRRTATAGAATNTTSGSGYQWGRGRALGSN